MGFFSSLASLGTNLATGNISGAVGSLGSMFDSAAGQSQANKAAEKQYQNQLALAALQNNYNVQMWNRNNQYNLPSAQRQRLIDAGLNPNIMYGSGGVMNTSQSAPASAVGVEPKQYMKLAEYQAQLASMAQTRAQTSLMDAQRANIEADTKKKLSEVPKNEAQTSLFASQTEYNNALTSKAWIDVDVSNETKEWTIKSAQAEYDRIVKNNKGLDLSNEQKDYFVHNILPQTLEKLKKENRLTEQQIRLAAANVTKIAVEIKELYSRIGLNQARANEAFTHIHLMGAQEFLTEQSANKVVSEINILGEKINSIREDVKLKRISRADALQRLRNLFGSGTYEPGKAVKGVYGVLGATLKSIGIDTYGNDVDWNSLFE